MSDAERGESGASDAEVRAWVLDHVRAFTSRDAPLCPHDAVMQARADAGYSREEVQRALAQLVDADELFAWRGAYAVATDEGLEAVVDAESEKDDPRRLLVKQVNRTRRRIAIGDDEPTE